MADINPSVAPYTREWYDKMIKIWRDRIDLMGAIKTGALRQSVSGGGLTVGGYDIRATFHFLQYGIYVDAGTGNGYRHGNGGNLAILDKDYRRAHGMKKQRKRRPWFSRSWYISREVLKDKLAKLIGEDFIGAVASMK